MSEESAGGRPNKSARKREMAELQLLAEKMATLTEAELVRLGVDGRLREALAPAREMRASGARNRQLKYCVKFMDIDELAEVVAYLGDRHSQQVAINREFHRLETWRERLLNEGDDALQELLETHPDLDRQQLRQLSRDAKREREGGKPAGAGRKLFRYLRETVFLDE